MTGDEKTTIEDLKNLVKQFIEDRDWGKYHNAKDVAISITIEASELLEVFQWVRDDELEKVLVDSEKRDSTEDELADVLIYCLSLANVTNIDVARAVRAKIEKNKKKYPIEAVKGNYRKYTELSRNKASDEQV